MGSNQINAFISHKISGNLSIFSFNTSNSYEMPVSLLTSDIQQFESVLTFAARLINLEQNLSDEYVKDTIFADYSKTIQANHAEALVNLEKQASSDMASKLSGLVQTISEKDTLFNEQVNKLRSDYDQQIKNLLKEKKKLEDDATATKLEIETSLQKEIKTLRKQITEKDTELHSLSKSETLIRDQCQSESERLIKIIEEKNSQTLKTIRDSYEQTAKLKEEALKQRELKITQKEEELQTVLQRNASSSFRGQDGESYFQTLAESKMKWKLTDTSKIPHSCDYSSVIHKASVFFEIKNYTNDVRQEEVTKFLRDMKEHPEVHVGIFISLNTRIAGKNSSLPISIEWIHDSQCAIYIQPFKELDTDHTLALIDQVIKLSGVYNKLIGSKGDHSEETILQPRIDKARVYIEEYITETSALIKRVTNDYKLHKQLVESSYTHTLAVLKTQAAAISTTLEILTGEYKEDLSIDESELVESPTQRKKPAKKASKS